MGRRLDVTGDDLAVIGAAALKGQLGTLNLRPMPVQVPDWMQNAHPQGISTPNEELDYLPLTMSDTTNGGAGAIDVTDRMTALPQRPFRGERVVLSAIKIGAAPGGGVTDALFALLITPAIVVGATQVGAAQGSMPGSAFSAMAFGVRLSFPVSGQGTQIVVPFFWPNLAAGERLIVTGGIFGRSVR